MKVGMQHLQKRFLYDEYRRRLDARAVLAHYGAENCSEQQASDGTTEISHSCLIDRVELHHAHGDINPSASCNVDKKVYICHQWWGGDLFHFIAKMEGKEGLSDIVPVVGQFLSGATTEGDALYKELEKLFVHRSIPGVKMPSYAEKVLEPWLVEHPYWAYRQISPEAIEKLRLGYDAREKRIVFPHFVDGKLVGWQKRLTPETRPAWPKYRNSLGFPKSETLYNLDAATEYEAVCVVESPMSVARAVSLEFPSVVATFGAKVTDQQIELLKQFHKVMVWFDDDFAGLIGERKLVRGLYRSVENVRVVVPDKGRDMADCGEEELCVKLSQAIPAPVRMVDYKLAETYGDLRGI